MKRINFENLASYSMLNAKPHLTPDEEALLGQLHHSLVGQYEELIPAVSQVVLAYRTMLGDVNEGLDGDACEDLAEIVRILINDHEGNL